MLATFLNVSNVQRYSLVFKGLPYILALFKVVGKKHMVV